MTSTDEPQPPGGPLREDRADGALEPSTGEDEEPGQSRAEADLQQENAETSLDQPSQ